MRSSRSGPIGRAALALLALHAGSAAFGQEDRSAQALARAQALLRQVSAQKQELEAANARLSAAVDALEQKLTRAEAGLKQTSVNLASEQRKAERTGGALDSTRDRLTRTEEKLRETESILRSTKASLQDTERQVAEVKGRLGQAESQLAESERKNLRLYQANVELLDLYKNKGPWTAMLQREPTGLKNVEIENIVQEYRIKLEDSLTDLNREAGRVNGAAAPVPESE